MYKMWIRNNARNSFSHFSLAEIQTGRLGECLFLSGSGGVAYSHRFETSFLDTTKFTVACCSQSLAQEPRGQILPLGAKLRMGLCTILTEPLWNERLPNRPQGSRAKMVHQNQIRFMAINSLKNST
jgi:hypothetical protein